MTRNDGLFSGCNSKQLSIIDQSFIGQFLGCGKRSPFGICSLTSLFESHWYGSFPKLRISHTVIPNDQTSEAPEYLPFCKTSKKEIKLFITTFNNYLVLTI